MGHGGRSDNRRGVCRADGGDLRHPGGASGGGAGKAVPRRADFRDQRGGELPGDRPDFGAGSGQPDLRAGGGAGGGRAVIIANGVQRRRLQCPGEEAFLGRGVSYCATCDGAFFKGKDAAVVGGGNTALEDALFLAKLCRTVYLVHRRDSFRGEKVLAEAIAQRPNIRPLFNKTVESIHGGQSVEEAALLDAATGERTRLPVSAVFVAIGMQPDNGLFAAAGLDKDGYIQADESCTTRLPGVFVAGDTRTKWLRQIITAAADGAVAAARAGHYLETVGQRRAEETVSPV